MTKKKKRRPVPVRLEPQPGWNLGRWVPVSHTSDRPIAEFLKKLIVKTQEGDS